jgi:histidinol-phosphate/aromatic aminotransferase/cobyric acid decarboxylase-like protein
MRAYGLPEWIRVSIGTMPQNQKFANILEAWQP